MKTISISDSAYRRLRAWKSEDADSFTKVIERVVPVRGTLSTMLSGAQSLLPQLSEEQGDKLEADINATRAELADPWNS